jgi:Arc/MetJ family transcription regulator
MYDACMRTNINIDDHLLFQAHKLTRLRAKREIVHRAFSGQPEGNLTDIYHTNNML